MKWLEIRKKAAGMGISIRGLKKPDLIRALQTLEGNVPCFDTGRQDCDQLQCCWRGDCLPPETYGRR